MSVQQFCLRWNNHQPNFISVCSSLLHNGTLVDVTLAAEGRQLQAHKIVLSACSSYFQTLFTTNPCQHPIVILKDVQYDDLKTMVDFMYYGEVNVSQEQLPHILKTAEMLKIKGLAEMPTDPANLTKSDNKANEPTELIGGASNINQGNASTIGGGTDRLGSNASGSASDSMWESTDSHFQQQLQQQQLHHQEQHHHPHQQVQPPLQQHSLRRTPSPIGSVPSLANRRKRLRKSSNNGHGERSGSEDQQSSSLDVSNIGSGVSLTQMCQMSFNSNQGSLSGIGSHLISTAKLLKQASNVEAPQDSDSLDDERTQAPIQIKPEVDISGVQSIPLDISGATTPSEHDAPNSQSAHSGLQWTVVDSNYSRFSLSSCQPSLIGNNGNQNTTTVNSGNNSELQQHQRPQQHQQQEGETTSVNNQEQQHLQQLQQYQQQHNTSYTSQIISVNSLVGGYSAQNSQQNLSPPSPNIVQTVYSQGTTPTQSPVHSVAGISDNGTSSVLENNVSSGIIGNNGDINGSGSVSGNIAGCTNGSSNACSQVVKRKRSVNPQGDENFIRALEAVRSGGIGFCKAARLYGVNNRTLWLEYKKRGYPVSRPSIKSRIVKQEPNISPSPTPPVNTTLGSDTVSENYEQIANAATVAAAQSAALNMQIPPASETSSSLMCAQHHTNSTVGAVTASQLPTMGVMSFLDARHMDLPALHSVSRQRYIDASNTSSAGSSIVGSGSAINVNSATAMNLHSMNFSSM